MKYLLILTFTFSVLVTACVGQNQYALLEDNSERDGVIYGNDSVRNIDDDHIKGSNSFVRNLKASAALINVSDVTNDANGDFLINDKTVEEKFGTCPDFKLSPQIAAAFCSGVLVRPNMLLTAAHCLDEEATNTCESTVVAFGYSKSFNDMKIKTMPKNQIYHCKKIIALNNYKNSSEVDYALIELDRPVENVQPVKFAPNKPADMTIGDEIYTVGYPVGTTKKIARGEVRSIGKQHHNPKAALDIYFGNSGGPIFKTATNELVGVVSDGEDDFETTAESCQTPKRCTDDGCLGETLTPLPKIIKDLKAKSAL